MNSKHTWSWFVVAAAVFAFIFFFERHWRKPAPGPEPILPHLKAAAVTSVQIYPAGHFEIRAERRPPGATTWALTKPIEYPAQAARIEALLARLERLTPAAPPLTARELRQHPDAEVEYGLANPQVSLVIQQENYAKQIRFGALTSPGDQVFLRVEGGVDIYVVDAEVLKFIPRGTNDWRDTAFVDWRGFDFDRLIVNHAANVVEFERAAPEIPWRMTRPMPARAHNARVLDALEQLHTIQIAEFVADGPDADLEAHGLQPAGLELTFLNNTNIVARLGFGRTNDAGHVFARRQGLPGIVAVHGAPLAAWRVPFNEFRDRRLLSLPPKLGPVEVQGDDRFTLLPRTNGWRVAPQDFPVDAALADDFLATLATVEIEFFKNAVTEPDLRTNGLIAPARAITLKLPAPAGGTNATHAQLAFGVTNDQKVLVARADEDSIYALPLADFERLPWASWRLRERRIWNFTEDDVARLTIRQDGRTREILRLGTNSWTLAPGSQGIINGFAIEETAHRFGELSATMWVERGVKDPGPYGITTNSLTVAFELKSGGKHAVEFGKLAPSRYPYAAVTLNGERCVFEFPLGLYQLVSSYLTIPANTP